MIELVVAVFIWVIIIIISVCAFWSTTLFSLICYSEYLGLKAKKRLNQIREKERKANAVWEKGLRRKINE
jgi:hypothetical protein